MTESVKSPGAPATDRPHDELEEYAGGYIKAWVGRIPAWLLVVYAVLFIWALYYLVVYWGGLGPGRPA
jgi:hypothetical protein